MTSASRRSFSLLAFCFAAACSSDTTDGSSTTDGSVVGTLDGGAGISDAAPNASGDATGGSVASADGAISSNDASAADGSIDASTSPDAAVDLTKLAKFSFFVTSLAGMKRLSGSEQGFGGDLRFGETGDGAGLRGADKICAQLAEGSMPGATAKQWHAFLSTSTVHAKDRIGQGPWYDRRGRLVAENLSNLLNTRPIGIDSVIANDLPNETGTPNHDPDGTGQVDNHDTLTGSNAQGLVYSASNSGVHCNDWTDATKGSGKPRVGHTWGRGLGGALGGGLGGGGGNSMDSWISALDEAGCGAGVGLTEYGPPDALGVPTELRGTVGSGGGYGGIYCFALIP